MSTFKKENACAYEAVDAFGGIDRSALIGRLGEAFELENFRILSDGSIQKRDGYRLLCSLSAPIDAVRAVPGDDEHVFALSGGGVWRISLTDGTRSLIGSIDGGADTGGCFFSSGGQLYVLAGGQLMTVTDTSLTAAEGYAPLYGRGWDEFGGTVYQPRNLLSPCLRINYRILDATSTVNTGLTNFTVVSAYVNGKKTNINAVDGSLIRFYSQLSAGDALDVCLRLSAAAPHANELLSCDRALETGGESERVICYGGGGTTLFLSRGVSPAELDASQSYLPDSTALYFPDVDRLHVDLTAPIYLAGCGDRLVVSDSERSCLMQADGRLCPLIGVPGADGDGVCVDGRAYIPSSQGLYRVALSSGVHECLSAGQELPQSGADGRRYVTVYDARYSELLVADPSDDNGDVLVYSLSGKCCYRFSGIGAGGWFTCGDSLGFVADSGLFVFEPGRGQDGVLGGSSQPITAYLLSRWSDMSLPDRPKRLRSIRICSQGSEPLQLTLSDPAGTLAELSFPAGDGEQLDLHRRMLRTGRFEHVRMRLLSEGSGHQRILGVALYAIK